MVKRGRTNEESSPIFRSSWYTRMRSAMKRDEGGGYDSVPTWRRRIPGQLEDAGHRGWSWTLRKKHAGPAL